MLGSLVPRGTRYSRGEGEVGEGEGRLGGSYYYVVGFT